MELAENYPHAIITQIYATTVDTGAAAVLRQSIAETCGCEDFQWYPSREQALQEALKAKSGQVPVNLIRFDDRILYVVRGCSPSCLEAAEKLLEILHPHFLRVCEIEACFDRVAVERAVFESIAAQRGLMLLMYDRCKTLIASVPANGCASKLIGTANLDRMGLHIREPSLACRFDSALTQCIHGEASGENIAALSVPATANTGRPLRIVLIPWREPNLMGAAAIVLLGTDQTPWIDDALLMYTFGFSRGEVRVALQIIEGYECSEIAANLAVTEYTVRAHTKKLLAKSGTRNQAELVRMLLCSPAAYVSGMK